MTGTNEYHGDEDEIESAKQKKKENDPRDEPDYYYDWEDE